MEVFPPDDPQSNEVGNRPTVSQLEQIKAWDDSFANLEKVLQAACEKNDSHKDLNNCSRESTVSSVPETENSVNKSEIKRKWEGEIVDSVESNKQKLKRMNSMILNSGEVTIQLVNSPGEKCDNLPISNLLSSIKTETKTKYEDFTFDMPADKIPSDNKNAIEFIKLEPKAEIKDENPDIKIEEKPDIFSDLDKSSCIKEENSFSSDIKMIVSREIKNDSGFTDDLSTESKNEFYPQSDDPLSYTLKEESSEFKANLESKCSLLAEVSNVISDNISSISDSPQCKDNEELLPCNETENSEQTSDDTKEDKDKLDDSADRSLKKDDKLSKKKKFERCNIRDIKLDEELDAVTLSAQKEEQERIRRLKEAQMRALQERLQQIEVEKEALSQLFSQSTGDAPGLFDSNSLSETEVSAIEKKVSVKTESDVLIESSDEEKKAKLQNVMSTTIATPIEENIIDISSSSSGNESDSDDSDKKDDDIMVLSDEGEEAGESAEDPNNSGAHTNDCFNLPDEEGRVLVNVGHPPEDPDIFLAPQIAKVIKPHQIGGIRFLYDNVVENLERYKSSSGFGCILAHSMGLGKTVQVVSFVDVFLRHTPATLVLCIVPINTIQNWKAEFDMWVPPSNCVDDSLVLSGEVRPRDYNIYTLNENFKTMAARASLIAEWRKNGGVLLMGYEMYRMLALRKMPKIPVKKSKRLKKQELNVEPETNEQIKKYMEEMYEHIVIPGPDLVICDEGHRIKNSLASTSMALKSIKTRRRVVLTGYPLQNNLLEYWCMVDFVRPNYLGSRAEFCNMFERPISNGQCIDSTPRDRQLMRFRSHVLHSLLVGFVQRRGHSVLRAVLPKKEEHVLLIRMTPIQRQLYKCFVKDLLYVQQATNPLKLFAVCCKIWNHPDILYKLLQEKKAQEDIDLDIDITMAANSGVAGTNCGIRKRGYQSKSKVMQRSLKALPRSLKSETNFNSSNDGIKSEQVSCDQGNVQQVNDLKFDAHEINKDDYGASNQNSGSSQNEFSQQSSQSFQNTYALKNTMNTQFCPTNFDLSSGMQYSGNNQNNVHFSAKGNMLSPQQFSSQASSQSSSQNIYSQSAMMETQYSQQPQNQFSLGNSQHFSQVDSQIQSPYGMRSNATQDVSANHPQSPSQTNFQTKSQSFGSQSSNCSPYSQQTDLLKQIQNNNQDQYSGQTSSNQDTTYPQSPLPSSQKFVQPSQQYTQNSQQSYNNSQSSQQYSQQQNFNQASRSQFPEQQSSSQFSQQAVNNQSQTSFSQVSNQSSPMSEQSSLHHYSSQSPFQHSPPQSQFAQNSSSQQSSPLSQQFSHQSTYSQMSQQYNQQQASSSQQSSPTESQFPQATNQTYSQQYSQQSSDFSQTSTHQQFQQQNMQTFSEQQGVQSQFHTSHQSFSDTNQSYPQESSPQQQFSQQTFSQPYLQQNRQQYQPQTSQENESTSFGSSHQFPLQGTKFSSKQNQQNTFSQPQQSSVENIQYSSQSSQSIGQKQASPSGKGNKQTKFNQAYSEQSTDSQYSQIGQSTGFSQQLPQSNTQSFSEQISNMTSQYTVQQSNSLQFSSQISNSSQYSPQGSKPGDSYNSQYSQPGNQSSEQYGQSSQQYNQQSSQAPQYQQQPLQNAQQFSQQSNNNNTQQFDSNAQIFSPQTQSSQFSHQSPPSQKQFNQQVSQNSQTCSQQSSQGVSQYNQQVSTNFSQQQTQMNQQFSTQLPQSSQQYSQQSAQSPQQFLQQPSQTSQQYNQSTGQSAQLYTQQPSVSSQQYSQVSQSSPEYNPQSHSSQSFNQHSQSSPQYNQQTVSSQIFNESVEQSPQLFNQANQSSQQYGSNVAQSSQFNQTSAQTSQQFSAPDSQSSQQITQTTGQSPQQFIQGTTQSFEKSSNQTSQYNQQSSHSSQYNQPTNQSSQQFNQTSQMYSQPSSQTYKQTLPSTQYNQNSHNTQQFNQSSQSQFPQKNLQVSQQYSQQSYNQQPTQSPQQYNQQPAQSPQHFNQPVQSPQQFSQPVPSPQQFQQQAAPSPQQYSQHPVQSPQQFSQPPAPSPQQYQQTTASPQQFLQQPTQSPQQFSQQPAPSPQQFSQPARSPQQFSQPTPSPQQFSQPAPSPQQFSQPAPSPQQFSQPTQSPQQFSQPTQSPQQFSQPNQSPQQFSQPAPSPQHFSQPNQSPQQYSQTAPSPQQFSQPTPSPQSFSQPTPSPQSFSQPSPSPQQFSQPSGSSQQFNQQNPQVQYSQQAASQHFSQQPSQTSNQQYSHISSQSQYKQQTGQSSQYSLQQQCIPATQTQFSNSFSQPSNQSSGKGSFQNDYQTPTSVAASPQALSAQTISQQAGKQTSRGGKTKQSRGKPLSQTLLPQTSVQSNIKQPPSFSIQAFQNGNQSNMLQRPMSQQSIKSLQDSGNSLFQPLNTSVSNQEGFTLQHIPQDASGTYPAKCPKAILQPVKHQGQDSIQHSQMNSDVLHGESEHKSIVNSTDSAVVSFRDRMDSSINYEWAVPIMKDYVLGVLENSHKMMVLFVIIAETLQMGDKLLVFSQSLSTLDLLEQFLSKIQVPKKPDQPEQIVTETWSRNKNYFRLDGSTSAQEREKLINEFNRNDNVSLFLLSTRAGCLGINLVGANRIVVMDASWNPCHDAQAVCRIYRYGQKKQCYIYRLVTDNSLEKRIYDRQVNKQGMSDRVVDELNPESNFTWKDVTTLIQDDEDDGPVQELSKFASSYTDKVLKYLVSEMSPSLSKEPFEHESLLLDRKDLKLTKQEKRLAKQSYEMAKRANMINIRTTYTYLPAGTAGGGQFIINNKQCQWVGGTTIRVLPNQNNSAGGNTRSGTTATPITASPSLMSSLFKQGVMVQKLTMPSNVSIPVLTPGAPPVVIPAGQDVLVLRTPKGVYLRLPDGRIIAVQLPPSLLAKTQFRPNVVTHFRPAAPKGGNQSTTVINTPRGQSIGIIKQTLQCGGTVRYLGPRNAAGSSGHNATRGSAPEVIDLSDDDEPMHKHSLASNASANSSESESGSGDLEKPEKASLFPGKQITIRKISSNPVSSPTSKEKCDIPQVLSKNKQITILPINPSAQQNRQKFAPQLAQPVRVQQMLLHPQQGKRKPIQKSTPKIQMSPLMPGKSIRPQITITQPTTHSSFQPQKVRQPLSGQPSKNMDFVEKSNEQGIASVKPSADLSTVKMCDRSPKSSPAALPQSHQNNKNSLATVSESGKVHGNLLPPSLAALAVNPSLQITPASRSDSSVSDILSQKSCFPAKPVVQNTSSTSCLQNENSQNIHSMKSSLQITPTSRPETSVSDSMLLKTSQHSKSPVQNVCVSSSIQIEQQSNVVTSNKSISQISTSEPTVSDMLPHRTVYHSKSPIPNTSGLQNDQSQNVVQSLNPNLQITAIPRSEQSSIPDLFSQPKPAVQNVPQMDQNVLVTNSTKTTMLPNKTDNSLPQASVSQNSSNNKSSVSQLTNFSDTQSTASSQISAHQLQNSLQSSSFQQLLSPQMNTENKQKQQNQQQSISYSSQPQSLPNTQMSFPSPVSSVSTSQSQQVTPRKRKSSNKQPSKKSQQQHLLSMSQNHVLQPQTMESPQPFLHPQLSEHLLPENHFPTFSHHISGSDFTFSNFSSHKAAAHIQHPQPLHPLQHSQEHSLLPHLQHMSHLYPMPPHLAGTSSLPDTQPPAPRAWPVPQPSVSSFHPFSQSSPFFSSGQESSQFSFPSSFPLPPSTLTPSLTQSDSNANVASGSEKSSRISTSDM